jgi:hypothetical protein
MPYSRQRPRIGPTGRITIRLSTGQRDFLLNSAELPKALGHALHRAVVRRGELSARVTRGELDALIVVAAAMRVPDRKSEKELAMFLRYLESMEDRFEDANVEETGDAAEQADELSKEGERC